MKMKQISGATIQEALAIARRELGDDAVLLETKKNTKGKGVVVTFAIDGPDENLFDDEPFNDNAAILPFSPDIARATTAKVEIDHPALGLITEAFEYHQVPLALAQRLLTTLHKISLKPDALIEVAQAALADALAENIAFQPIATATKVIPKRAMMLVGPHGAGKTSTIAKLATELTLQKQPVVLISTDMERMGGAESLAKLADIIRCEFFTCETRAELKSLLASHQGNAWMLIDTAGANIYEFAPMRALGELASLQGVEPILTCPAGMDADEAQEMAGVFDFLNIERMIVTRLDAVRRLKSVFAVLTTGGYALSNLTNSAVPTDACQALSPVALSRLMLRHAHERLTH
jgi:flagellar biosynthesis protein FlhF